MTTVLNPPPSEVRLRVGAAAAVTTVAFNITAANAGNGIAIAGAPANIVITAEAREAGCAAKSATLSVTTPANLASGPNTIPFSTISWISSDADIPSGTYLSPGTFTLATFSNCRRVTNTRTFNFSNLQVFPSGAYSGTATYTLSMP
ncbi:MAG TPA: hypothetical protein VN878_07855 [Usitatibacter sp.]|nr:hypothetical protein [Usitatibacter sp.]